MLFWGGPIAPIMVWIAHAKSAKDANPTTLLTRFAEELPPSPRLRRTCRRAPGAGPDAGRGRRVGEQFLVSCDGGIDLFPDDVVGV